jgi:uncharacterized protein YjaG (DUF416 family)
MLNYTFDESQIAMRLKALDHIHQVAFALSCAERMLPNYKAFQRENKWGKLEVLRSGIDNAWQWLDGKRIPAGELSKIGSSCEEQAPDTEDFQSFVSPALDAALAVAAVLALIQTQDVYRAVEVVSLSRDTVDMFVQELENMPPNAPDLEERIRLHPLMQAELELQHNDLAALEAGIDLAQLSARWKSPTVSNIGLS